MQKNLTLKITLISILLLCSGFIAVFVFDANPLARVNPAGRQLDRLLDDMQVIRIPGGTNPVEVRLQDLNGTSVDLADFRGKIVFLNFWATWCPTCVVEMPAMEKLHRKLKVKDFAMVTISIQDSVAAVKEFFEKNNLTFTALLDSFGNTVPAFGIRAIPTTFILDKAGRIIGLVMGPREWDSRESIAMFEYLIDRYTAVSAVPASDPINLDNM